VWWGWISLEYASQTRHTLLYLSYRGEEGEEKDLWKEPTRAIISSANFSTSKGEEEVKKRGSPWIFWAIDVQVL